MALNFPYYNVSRAAGDYMGRALFDLKEAMVAAGWTVRGSGDGASLFAFDTTESSTATAGGATTLTDGAQSWTTNIWATGTVTITGGTGSGQTRTISSNTGTVLTVSVAWTTNPDNTSVYTLSKTAATPGSGGSFDVWVTGNQRTNSTPSTAGDAGNASAWILLECGAAPRQVILQLTSGTGTGGSGWSGYANVIYNPNGTGGGEFTAIAANASSAPGSAGAQEINIFGSRDGTGSAMHTFNTAGYFHVWYDDDATKADSARTAGLIGVDTTAEVCNYLIFCAMDDDSVRTGDTDPFCIAYGNSAPGVGSFAYISGWSEASATVVQQPVGQGGSVMPGYGGSAPDSKDGITQSVVVGSTTGGSEYAKGRIAKSAFAITEVGRNWGDRGTDQNGRVWVVLGANGPAVGTMIVPWVAQATAPLPGTNTTRTFWDVSADFAIPGPTIYYGQKVWDTGGGGRWCYYEQTAINASPLSGDTTPNWSGTISTHMVISVRSA